MIELTVERIAIDADSKMPVIILKEKEGERALLLQVGPFEAQAIAFQLEKMEPARPLTHDLARSLVERLHAKAEKVIIGDMIGSVLYAHIFIRKNGDTVEIDSRPSDAIALALRFKIPILISKDTFNKMIAKPIGDREVESFKKELKDLRPEDFGK